MQDLTTVLVDAPFLRVCGAVHMQELMDTPGQEDPLGLRERLLIATIIPASCAQLRCRKLAHASRLPPCMTILQSAFGLCMSCITPITHQSNARREREPLLHGEVRTGPVWIHCLGPMANSCQLDRERAGCQGWQALACWPDKTKPPTSCTKRCPFGSFQAPRLESLVQPTSIVRDRNRTLFRANSLSIRLWWCQRTRIFQCSN